MTTDDHSLERGTTRRRVLAVSGSATVLGLAGCIGDDDDVDDGSDDSTADPDDDDDVTDDGGTTDDGTGDPAASTVSFLVEGATGDRDYEADGLGDDEIDHACGHLEFDEPESLEAGETETDAPAITDTHQPFEVTVAGDAGYVRFEAPDADGHDDHASIEVFELNDRSDDETVAYIHGDHWHGGLSDVPVDDNVSLDATVVDEDGDEIDIDGSHWELRVDLAEGAPDIVWFDHHGDHVHVYGEADGTTEVVFELWHDDHVEYETPPLTTTVGNDHDHDDHGEIESFEINDRSEDERVAYVDDDHWHGSLPVVPIDDNLSLDATVEDDHGDEIEIDGDHYELRVDLATGAEDIVWFDHHGDHVHVYGEEDGTTEIVFELWHDDHVEYESPTLEIEVGSAEHTSQSLADSASYVANDDHEHDDDYDDGSQTFAFFTTAGVAEAVVGDELYAATDVEGCDAIDRYVIVEADHGEVVLELTPE